MDYPQIIKDLPKASIPLNGATAHLLQGQNNQLVFFDFKEDTEIPMHMHGAQWGIVVDGKIELTIGGKTKTYQKGDSYSIKAGEEHGGKIYAGFKAIDFFEEKDRY
ncbi:MAG: cupin domain-containing protein [Bacteroidales bacterium]|nr:cupin domain-containing protein [Bacteroidales bacterium]MCF8405152.1 cupin domain-containing protein [Bacteroidales bacterium]